MKRLPKASESSTRSRALRRSVSRARARRDSGGAVMFIVVVTLGLLAAMGVYGLSAAQADVRAAGHMREALQAQKAGEHALTMAAETLNPENAGPLVATMSSAGRTANCKTAAALGAGVTPVPPAAACLRLTETGMRNAAGTVSPWAAVPAFASDSFGAVTSVPNVSVELSDPFDVQRPGFDASMRFTQITATVFVDVRSTVDLGTPAQAIVTGRGRLTVGPISPPPATY